MSSENIDLMDRVHELSTELPAHDVGGRGEEIASETIGDMFVKLGLKTDIDGFTCPGGLRIVRSVYMLLVVAAAFICFASPSLSALAVVLAAAGLVLIYFSFFKTDVLAKLFIKTESQNVIGRYIPPALSTSPRRSKIVIAAHYDVERPSIFHMPALRAYYPIVQKAVIIACAVVLLCCILCLFPLPDVVKTVFAVIALIGAALMIFSIVNQLSAALLKPSKGANSNASSLATMIALAEKVVTAEVVTPKQDQEQEAMTSMRPIDSSIDAELAYDSHGAGPTSNSDVYRDSRADNENYGDETFVKRGKEGQYESEFARLAALAQKRQQATEQENAQSKGEDQDPGSHAGSEVAAAISQAEAAASDASGEGSSIIFVDTPASVAAKLSQQDKQSDASDSNQLRTPSSEQTETFDPNQIETSGSIIFVDTPASVAAKLAQQGKQAEASDSQPTTPSSESTSSAVSSSEVSSLGSPLGPSDSAAVGSVPEQGAQAPREQEARPQAEIDASQQGFSASSFAPTDVSTEAMQLAESAAISASKASRATRPIMSAQFSRDSKFYRSQNARRAEVSRTPVRSSAAKSRNQRPRKSRMPSWWSKVKEDKDQGIIGNKQEESSSRSRFADAPAYKDPDGSIAAEEARRFIEAKEAARKAAEEERKAAEEAARKAAEEARQLAAEEARKAAEEARRAAEEQTRETEEEQAKLKAAEEARRKAAAKTAEAAETQEESAESEPAAEGSAAEVAAASAEVEDSAGSAAAVGVAAEDSATASAEVETEDTGKTDVESESSTDTSVEADAEAESEATTEADAEAEADTATEADAETETDTAIEADAAAEADATTEAEAETETEAEAEATSEDSAKEAPAASTEAEATSKPAESGESTESGEPVVEKSETAEPESTEAKDTTDAESPETVRPESTEAEDTTDAEPSEAAEPESDASAATTPESADAEESVSEADADKATDDTHPSASSANEDESSQAASSDSSTSTEAAETVDSDSEEIEEIQAEIVFESDAVDVSENIDTAAGQEADAPGYEDVDGSAAGVVDPGSTIAYTPKPISQWDRIAAVSAKARWHREEEEVPPVPEPVEIPLREPESEPGWPSGSYRFARSRYTADNDENQQAFHEEISDFSRDNYLQADSRGRKADYEQSSSLDLSDMSAITEDLHNILSGGADSVGTDSVGADSAGADSAGAAGAPQADAASALQTDSANVPQVSNLPSNEGLKSDSKHGRSSTEVVRESLLDLPLVGSNETEITMSGDSRQRGLDLGGLTEQDSRSNTLGQTNLTGAFAPLDASGVMPAVTSEMLNQYNEGESLYIDDADDSSFNALYNDEGSYVGAINVEPAKKRRFSFFGNRKSKKRRREELETSASEWLGVSDDYDARVEGGYIGSWDNFDEDDSDWRGGAFGAPSESANRDAIDALSDELLNKEIWFVALGAAGASNAGMRDLLKTHASELKHARIVNLDSIGAGDLFYTTAEPKGFFSRQVDPRMQKLVQQAARAARVDIEPTNLTWKNTQATTAMDMRARAITIIALDENGTIPGWRWLDDTEDIVSRNNLNDVFKLLIELIKNC